MRVFLSYRSADEPIAQDVKEQLNEAGFEVWSDDEIRVGDSLPTAIHTAIKGADAFVLLIGGHSSESPWMSWEAGAALASGKPVIPALAEKGAEVPLILQDLRYLDLSDPERRRLGIESLTQTLSEGAPVPRPEEGLQFHAWASNELATERELFKAKAAARSRALLRTQILAAAVGVATAASALGIIAISDASVLAVLASGLIGALLSALAFYFGSSRSNVNGDRP